MQSLHSALVSLWDNAQIKTAVVTCVATVSAISLYNQVAKYREIARIKQEMTVDWSDPSLNHALNDDKFSSVEYEELVQEQLSRNTLFLGQDAHMLVRAGVERIRLIDFDQVSLSSLNRHAVATRADVGTPKVLAMKKHLLETVPHARIDAVNQLFNLEHAHELLKGDPDFVLDCIDNLETKAQLIGYCSKHKLKIIASMGAGAKADPSRIQIADINETIEDQLAKQTRKTLRAHGFEGKVPCVYSTEKPGKVGLTSLSEDKVEDADQYAPLPSFRSRILPVLGTIPALFGNAMASYVLTELACFPTDPLPFKTNKKQGERFWRDLYSKEVQMHGGKKNEHVDMFVTAKECGFIFEDTWRSRSALGGSVNDRLFLVRWDPTKRAELGNLICLTKSQAEKHEQLQASEIATAYPKEFLAYVQSRFEREAKVIDMLVN
ncbi:hypothetical protein HDU91_006913 [Kappamyces sp. JEL0680]|nr:hypothetical protein HDU91_006913 [Kappamyces sp. JEL0680]